MWALWLAFGLSLAMLALVIAVMIAVRRKRRRYQDSPDATYDVESYPVQSGFMYPLFDFSGTDTASNDCGSGDAGSCGGD